MFKETVKKIPVAFENEKGHYLTPGEGTQQNFPWKSGHQIKNLCKSKFEFYSSWRDINLDLFK